MANFIDENIKIDFPMPKGLIEYITYAEIADKNNAIGDYYAYADMIDTIAKNCHVAGLITKEMWEALQARYL